MPASIQQQDERFAGSDRDKVESGLRVWSAYLSRFDVFPHQGIPFENDVLFLAIDDEKGVGRIDMPEQLVIVKAVNGEVILIGKFTQRARTVTIRVAQTEKVIRVIQILPLVVEASRKDRGRWRHKEKRQTGGQAGQWARATRSGRWPL